MAGEPAEQQKRGGARIVVQIDLNRLDLGKLRKGSGVIEEAREGVAPRLEAGPIQIAQDGALVFSRREMAKHGKLMRWIVPLPAVVDEAVHPGPERFIERFGQVALPPKTKRQVGIEMGKNNVGQRMGALAIETKGDLLGAKLAVAFACLMAMGIDPSLRGRSGSPGI